MADSSVSFEITGLGDVLEPKDGVIAIGSGGTFALGAFVVTRCALKQAARSMG